MSCMILVGTVLKYDMLIRKVLIYTDAYITKKKDMFW